MTDERLELTEMERFTHELYGKLWVEFDETLYDQSIALFAERLETNKFDLSWFKDKRCLDAGCGAGRYVIAMSQLGASEVIGIDIGSRGLAAAAERARARGVTNVRFERGSVLNLPFEDSTFDFACSNGVLHHTEAPDKGLAELFRVLRPGGKLFLYVFGDGGVLWAMADVIRALRSSVAVEVAQSVLQLMNVPANRSFNFLDLCYVPIQRRYSGDEVAKWLTETGFTEIQFLPRGTRYDTNAKILNDPTLGTLIFGEGDLRYLAQRPTS